MELSINDYEIFEVNGIKRKVLNSTGLAKIISSIKPYAEWTKSIKDIKQQHPDFKYGSSTNAKSLSFQGINFITDEKYRGIYFNRDQLALIVKTLLPDGPVSRDIIQVFNKTDQKGLQRDYFTVGKNTYYGCSNPTFTDLHLAKRSNITDFGKQAQDEGTARCKRYLQHLINGKWQIGHKDPSKGSAPDNLVMQPAEINRAAKDRWIFNDDGIMPAFPTFSYFIKNVHKYYGTNWEEIMLQTILASKGKEWIKKIIEK